MPLIIIEENSILMNAQYYANDIFMDLWDFDEPEGKRLNIMHSRSVNF